ncbi:gp34.55 [Bacillus phage SPO1]|uniref:Gp34.55 n=1 Tax=Bacillus phage SP01 TaxID=2884427 RepID=B6V305_BPSP1|nr:gp34.55 [Bacillus phage SPO1]ACI91087.1 gp34.55 [Bacillus phage SPO1]
MKRLFFLVPLLALTLSGCGGEEEEKQEKKLPERLVEVSHDEVSEESDSIYTIQDKETGCQYLLIKRYSGGTAVSPILKPDGKPYCVEVKHEKTRGN